MGRMPTILKATLASLFIANTTRYNGKLNTVLIDVPPAEGSGEEEYLGGPPVELSTDDGGSTEPDPDKEDQEWTGISLHEAEWSNHDDSTDEEEYHVYIPVCLDNLGPMMRGALFTLILANIPVIQGGLGNDCHASSTKV